MGEAGQSQRKPEIGKLIVLLVIRFYQKLEPIRNTLIRLVNPFAKGSCRFTPTCSQYTYQAIERYGIVKGVLLGGRRVLRCHPWSVGGHDPVP